MSNSRKYRDREKDRRIFEQTSIEDIPGEEVEVEVAPTLSAMLSLRLDQEHFDKLKLLARAQDTGVTTLARKILQHALDNPGQQLFMKAMESDGIKEQIALMMDQASVPPSVAKPDFLVIPMAELERITSMMQESAQQMWLSALQSKGVKVTPDQHDLHEKLKELEVSR
jgi:hypothetical protein